jgi:hypothetical protein
MAPKIRQEYAKNYTRYFHIETFYEFLFTYEVLKHDKWCSIFCWEHGHYTYVTENRSAVVSLHDMEKYSSTHS